ncbi:hypothetical protein OS493_019746 [Desmophyllum pertusum]|uniref:Uncharacterized protein n=1 Tax=Desmophyllum pertusum TaxID=174260 RepID=A0A9W9YZD5_9CNID|nr:hypothetical protein OS493_019746 [Desmophyllum pertusum]
MDRLVLPRLQRNLRIIGKQIRTLPSRIRRAMRRGLERVLARLGMSRDPDRKLERFQSSIEKIFSTKRHGSRGADESSGFISDEEELEDVPRITATRSSKSNLSQSTREVCRPKLMVLSKLK